MIITKIIILLQVLYAVSIRLFAHVMSYNSIYRARVSWHFSASISDFYFDWKYEYLDDCIKINSDTIGRAFYCASDLLFEMTFYC